MAFVQKSAVAAGHQNPLTPSGQELVRARFEQPLAAADHEAGRVGVIGMLPAGTLPAHLHVRVPQALGAGFKASIGLANAAGSDFSTDAGDGGAAWVVEDTTGAAGGFVQVVPAAFARVAPKDVDRKLLLKVAAPGTGTPAGLFAVDLVYSNA